MKSKVKIAIVVGFFIIVVAVLSMYFYISRLPANYLPSNQESYTGECELIASVTSEEEANEIADLYEIDLKSYSAGIAVFTTTKPADEVIRYGLENGYPKLEKNRTLYAD